MTSQLLTGSLYLDQLVILLRKHLLNHFINRRIFDREVGNGQPGPITSQLSTIFYDVIKGNSEKYKHWCTPARARVAR